MVSVAEEKISRRAQLSAQRRRAERELDAFAKSYLNRRLRYGKIVGYAVGLKFKDYQLSRPLKYVIRVYVQAKLSGDLLAAHDQLPDVINGVEVDVFEMRPAPCDSVVGAPASNELTLPHNPLVGGCAISCDLGRTAGTLGMVVMQGKQPMLLTNQHVAILTGNQVWQPPSGAPGVPTNGDRVIGVVASTVLNGTKGLDCALILPNNPNRPPSAGILGIPDGSQLTVGQLTEADEHQTQVFKVGATTGASPQLLGTVDNVSSTFWDQGLGKRFDKQITIIGPDGVIFCNEGDSGAVVFQPLGPTSFSLVGLIRSVASHGQIGVACHFAAVKKALTFTLPQ